MRNLRKIIETALNNNRDFRLAALNVEMSKGTIMVLNEFRLFPSVNGAGSMYKERIPGDLSSSGNSVYRRKIRASISALLPGKLISSAASAA